MLLNMFAPLRNLTFHDVAQVKLFTALKREARFKWLKKTDQRYTALQKLCNDIRESTVNVQMPIILLRNDNPGGPDAMGDTSLMFVANNQAWQIIRDWLHTVGIRFNWW